MSLVPDSLAGWPTGQRLCLALGASLALHLGGLAALQCVIGVAAEMASVPAAGRVAPVATAATAMSAVLLASPQGRGRAGPQPASGAPDARAEDEASEVDAVPGSRAVSAEVESGKIASGSEAPAVVERPNANESSAPPASAERLAALGQRLPAASVPPLLVPSSSPELSAGAWYFPRSELSVGAVPLDEPSIEPPDDSAGDALRGGKVVLRVFLAADGAVDRVEVASSSLPPAFGEAAVAAFSRLRFRPGEIQGVAVSSESRFEVAFDAFEAGRSHATDRQGMRSSAP